jgi:hypothetical protein
MIAEYSSEHVNYFSNYTKSGYFLYWLLKNEPSSMDFITVRTTVFVYLFYLETYNFTFKFNIIFIKT